LETDTNNDFVPAAEFYAHPNPFYQEVDLVYFNSRAYDNTNDEINDLSLVKIYNVKGQYMRSLVADSNDDGISFFHWDGYNFKGNKASTGVYFFRHQNSGILTKAVILK
jgi:flagellar hook assembly protein FlgD